jgi:hypothetical protein
MATVAPLENVPAVNATARVSFLVGRADAKTAQAILQGLPAAGVRVAAIPTAWDVVVEMERARGARYLFLGVDYFGRDEFRLIPLVRREWPDTVVIALASAGFEHQGRLAELVGADVVLTSLDGILAFVNGLAPGAPPSEPRPARVPAPTGPPTAAPKTDNAARGSIHAPASPEAPAADGAPTGPPAAAPKTDNAARGSIHAPASPEAPAADGAPTGPPAAAPKTDNAGRGSVHAPASPEAPAAGPVPPDHAPPARPQGPTATSDSKPPAANSPDAGKTAVASPAQSPAVASKPQPPAASPLPRTLAEDSVDDDDTLAGGRVIGTIEVTEEELRLLLGEDEQPQPRAGP